MPPLKVRRAASAFATEHCAGNSNLHLLLVEAFINGFQFAQSVPAVPPAPPAPLAAASAFPADSSAGSSPAGSIPPFSIIWNLYDRKDNKQNALRAWNKLSNKEKQKAFLHIPDYVKAHPDKRFRPMLATYLNQKRFNDEEIIYNTQTPTNDEQQQRLISYAEAIARVGEESN